MRLPDRLQTRCAGQRPCKRSKRAASPTSSSAARGRCFPAFAGALHPTSRFCRPTTATRCKRRLTQRARAGADMLDDKVALVTGATRGIGMAIARVLARDKATVIGTATSDEGGASISAYLKDAGNAGEGIRLDVSDSSAVDSAIAAIQTRYGDIAILVNNAGITRDGLLLRMKEDDWDSIMDTNLKSAYRLSKAVLRGMMKARYGRIISVGSVVGISGNAGQTNYAAAKAALVGFTKSLAQEVGSRAITVNCVAPGFIDTDMTRALSDAQRQTLVDKIPLGRLGTPQEVAHAVAFLASPEAGYITGATLHVNGGMYMT